MTDDIVARLRTDFECYDHAREAADEIERLRKLTNELAQMMMPFSLLMTSEEQQKVLKAVKDGL